jgi:hypothetical protein
MRDYIPLNLALMANPVNWVIVALMVLLGGMALAYVTQLAPAPKNDQTATGSR